MVIHAAWLGSAVEFASVPHYPRGGQVLTKSFTALQPYRRPGAEGTDCLSHESPQPDSGSNDPSRGLQGQCRFIKHIP